MPGLCARLRLRPLPGVLEPRVHAVRPPGGRLHAGAAAPQPRYGHGPGAHGRHHAAQELVLRRRRHAESHQAGRGDLRQDLRGRRLYRGLPLPAHHRRPRPLRELPHLRRRAPRQRGPRIRAAPPAAPRRVPRPPARHRGRVPGPFHRRGERRHGRRLPEPARERRPGQGHRRGRGGAFLHHPQQRSRLPGRAALRPRRGRAAPRFRRLHAARHLRVPHRPHRRDRRGRRSRRRHRGLQRRDGRAEGPRPRRRQG